MLGSELFIGCIDFLKSLKIEQHSRCYQKRKDTGLSLEYILDEIDFGYDIANGKLKLIDFRGVNFCDIENERFEIDTNLAGTLLDRLSVYLDDYILGPIREDLCLITARRPEELYCTEEILKCMHRHSYMFTNKQFLMVEAIADPTKVRIDNVIKNIKRSN